MITANGCGVIINCVIVVLDAVNGLFCSYKNPKNPEYIFIIGAYRYPFRLTFYSVAYINGNLVNICKIVALTISTKNAPTIGTIKNAFGDGK